MKKQKQTLANRWWFEGSRWMDERCWHGAERKWHWWKDAVPAMNEDYRKFGWRNGEERAAFAYELARRSSTALLSLPTYPELTAYEQDFLKQHFGVADCRWAARSTRPGGYSDTLPHHWNLRETDTALCKLFVSWLAWQREKFGIPKPKARPTKSRPVSWTWLEILDTEHGLDESERSIKTKARRLAQQYSKDFKAKLPVSQDAKKALFRV